MKLFRGSVLLCLIFFIKNIYACEIVDDEGHIIKLLQPAQRIVSLAPDLTEVIFAAGAGDKLIGVVKGSDYPVAALKILIVATFNNVDLEKIFILHPDLIIAWTEASYISQLKKLDVPIYLSHQKKLTDIAVTLRKVGCLAGTENEANRAANHFLTHYAALKKKYSHRSSISVFYQIWPKPLMTITKNSWINEAISLCGGKNIFADLKGVAPEIGMESVVIANPDVIIGTDINGLQQWQAWLQLTAVRNKHLLTIDSDLIERAGPRILDGVEEMCEQLAKV